MRYNSYMRIKMIKIINVVVVFVSIQAVFSQHTTIPLGRKCGCLDMPLTTNPQIPLATTNLGYQNLVKQITSPLAVGNIGLLMSNGQPITTPVSNAILNAMQLTKLPTTNNIQFSSAPMSICQEGMTAGVSVAPNTQAINFGNVGNIASIPNVGNLANIANVGALANIANVGALANIANVGSLANIANGGSLANIGLQIVPNGGNVNVPVRLRRNIQKNFGGLCNSAITYDSTLLGLY